MSASFKGLFIGIDRYASANVDWLSCAVRDATALEALFSDSLGGNTTLLTDSLATRESIQEGLEALSSCDPDDIVVIAYSGHGSDSHEIVCFDSDPNRLAETSISLEELASCFSKIPARNLILILDCCFSGGIGSKVLHAPLKARNAMQSIEALLLQLSGEGRLILTASSATEAAWENGKIGHGLLTHFLIEALQGAEEVRDGDRVSVYRLLDYVVKQVESSALALGEVQHPTIRGTIDGALYWPTLRPGLKYRAAFPERSRPIVSDGLSTLAPYGFPEELIETWAGRIPGLNSLQIRAINEFGVLDGSHLLVSAPTSSGKTMIGELAALQGAGQRKRSLFLMPLKALVNDKQQEFIAKYGQYGIQTIQATGESVLDDIAALIKGQYDICLMTYEKFTALVLIYPHILNQVGTIVVDEVQMIADESRGVNVEFLLTLLRVKRRQGIEPQIIALSAVIGDTNGFERWLGGRLLATTERPVPLDEGILNGQGDFRYIARETNEEHQAQDVIQPEYRKGSSQDLIIPLVRKLVQEGKQVIVFRETKGLATGCASYLAQALELKPADQALAKLSEGDPSAASDALRTCLASGVAFHISDLDRDERAVIEEEFRQKDSQIRVIAATTTLAMGVNTPAEAVVISGLEHPGKQPYSVAEYKNIAGRAGRLGFSDRGTSYLIANNSSEAYSLWQNYVLAQPESIESRFFSHSSDPRTLILRVLSAASGKGGEGLTDEEVISFLEDSFSAFRESQISGHFRYDRDHLAASVRELHSHQLVARDENGRLTLTQLGLLAGQGGVQVESMLRVIRALQGLAAEEVSDPTLVALCQLTVELDDVYYPINKKSTEKEPALWFAQLSAQGVASHVQQVIRNSRGEHFQRTLRAKKTVACLMWISEMPIQEIEKAVNQFSGPFGGGAAGPTRSVASRTVDLLPIVVRTAELVLPGLDLNGRAPALTSRLECGASHKHLELALELGTRLSRADYQSLAKERLCTLDEIAAARDSQLLSCMSGNSSKVSMIREGLERITKRLEVAPEVLEIPAYIA